MDVDVLRVVLDGLGDGGASLAGEPFRRPFCGGAVAGA
jgi:hypothetical protein